MARPSRFSPEVRERAVRMVLEHAGRARVAVGGDHVDRREDRVHGGDAAAAGCGRPSVTRGRRPGLTTDERDAAQAARARERRAAAGERDPAEGVGVFRPGGARPPSRSDGRRSSTSTASAYGVEPICAVLPIAPSMYYEHKAAGRDPDAPAGAGAAGRGAARAHRPRVARRTARSTASRKVWRQLRREGHRRGALYGGAADAARWACAGAVRGRAFTVTTIPDTAAARPPDLVHAAVHGRRGRTSCGSRT